MRWDDDGDDDEDEEEEEEIGKHSRLFCVNSVLFRIQMSVRDTYSHVIRGRNTTVVSCTVYL